MPALKIDALPCTPARKITRPSLEQSSNYGLYRHGYILGKTLESGSYAKVKSARSVKLNKEVAIKIISKKSAPKDFIKKFLPQEIKVMRRFEHKKCVKLYNVIHTDDYICLYDNVVSRGWLPPEFYQLDLPKKSAQAHYNSMKIVHRDFGVRISSWTPNRG